MSVATIVNQWDPYSLFPYAPSDEYSGEINKIIAFMKSDYDQTDLILELKRIFDESDIVEDKRDFSTIAEKLITA